MGLMLSLLFGLGVLLIYLSATRPRDAGRRSGASGPTAAARIQTWLDDAGLPAVRPRQLLAAALISALVTGAAAWWMLGWLAPALVAAVLGAGLPRWYLARRADRLRAERQAALAELVDALRASVRVGMSIEDALTALAQHGPAPLRPLLRDLVRDLRLAGFEQAIERAAERMGDAVFDTITAALLMTHRVGGRNLGPVLDSLERAVRGAARVEQEVRAHQARTVLSARVIAVLPLGLVVVIRGLNPDYLDPFATATGQLLLAGCLVSVVTGYLLMLRAARLPEPPRDRASGRRQPTTADDEGHAGFARTAPR